MAGLAARLAGSSARATPPSRIEPAGPPLDKCFLKI
jgi:hypothetical protein